ncbi:hypothetical protein CL628_03055 [bacterium]|nr:hypothetical protein [bacterium]
MRPRNRELVISGTILLIALLMHLVIGRLLGFGLTLPVLASLLFTWTLRNPIGYVVALGVVAELLTTQPPLIVFVAVALPLLVWRFRGRAFVDVSFMYIFLIAVTVFLQLAVLLASDVLTYGQLPIGNTILTWLALTLLATSGTVGIVDLLPVPQQSVISLEGYKLDRT